MCKIFKVYLKCVVVTWCTYTLWKNPFHLLNLHISSCIIFLCVKAFKFYSLSKCQLYNTMLSTILTMLYTRSFRLNFMWAKRTQKKGGFISLFSNREMSGFNNTWTVNFQMFKLVLEKAEEPEIKLPTSAGTLKKQESSRRTSISALLTMPKPLTVWITINWKILKEMGISDHPTRLWEICMQVRKQQLELDMEQQTDSK